MRVGSFACAARCRAVSMSSSCCYALFPANCEQRKPEFEDTSPETLLFSRHYTITATIPSPSPKIGGARSVSLRKLATTGSPHSAESDRHGKCQYAQRDECRCAHALASSFPPRHEGEAFEEHDVLLVFQQRAVQWRDDLARSRSRSVSGWTSSFKRSFSQSRSSEVEGFLRRPGTSRRSKNTESASATKALLDAGEMHVDDLLHRLQVGEFDVVEEAAAQEGVGQLLLVVRRDDDDRAALRLHRLAGFVDEEFHAVQLLQQVVGEFDVGLVDLVDQQHRALVRRERLPQLAAANVVGDVVHALVAQLRIAQAATASYS